MRQGFDRTLGYESAAPIFLADHAPLGEALDTPSLTFAPGACHALAHGRMRSAARTAPWWPAGAAKDPVQPLAHRTTKRLRRRAQPDEKAAAGHPNFADCHDSITSSTRHVRGVAARSDGVHYNRRPARLGGYTARRICLRRERLRAWRRARSGATAPGRDDGAALAH